MEWQYWIVRVRFVEECNGWDWMGSQGKVRSVSGGLYCLGLAGQSWKESEGEIKRKCGVNIVKNGVATNAYAMDYINDPDTYKAVMYCCKLIRSYGKQYNDAVRMASFKYKVPMGDIRHYMSQRSARSTRR